MKIPRKIKRVFYWVDQKDLYQQFMLIQVEARLKYRESLTTALLRTISMRELTRYFIKNNAPVSASWHDIPQLKSTYAVAYDEVYPCENVQLFEHYAKTELDSIVRNAVMKCCAKIPHGRLAVCVLLGEEKPSVVANQHNVEVSIVYRAIANLKRLVKKELEHIPHAEFPFHSRRSRRKSLKIQQTGKGGS